MSDWGITTKVPAEVVLVEGIVLAGDLHLYARPTYPPGPETPLEMLNRADVFFALTLNGGVTFVPKSQVVVVTCRGQSRTTDPDRLTAAQPDRAGSGHAGGRGVPRAGRWRSCRRPAAGRSISSTAPSVFFELGADDVTWYFNKSRIRLARPLD